MDYKKQHHEYSEETVEITAGDRALIKRLLVYLRPYRTVLIIAVCFLLFSKLTEASIPLFIGHLTQTVLDHLEVNDEEKVLLLNQVLNGGLLTLGLLIFCYLLDSANVILRSWIGQKGLYRLRRDVYEHILAMPLSFFDRNAVGRLMTRTIHDVDQINQMFADSVIPIIGNIFLFFGIFVGIIILDWRIAVLVSLILPLVWLLTHRFRKFQRLCYNRVRTVVSAMNTFVQEHLMGASIIRNFGLQARAKKQFEEINEDYCNAYVESIHHFSFFIAGIDLIQNTSLILAFVLIVIFSQVGTGFEAGIYLSFSLYSLMFFRPLADLAERYNVLQSAMSAALRIFNLLDERSERRVDKGKIDLDGIASIVFEDVWFSYEKENWVLKGLSIEIHKGHSYAIVGMTGEGKSTIMSLLLRFYEPQKGRIVVNGLDICQYSLASLRRQFSLVLQDPVIFSGTIGENIALFDQSIPRQDIEVAIDYLGMRFLIEHYPEGLDHSLHEQGKGLSTGEMQLISLARAIVHRRSVLILDEATANVDAATEQVIQHALHAALNLETAVQDNQAMQNFELESLSMEVDHSQKVKAASLESDSGSKDCVNLLSSTAVPRLKQQTSLVIAHRLSTIKDAAHILVLQGGKIAETGTHQSLLEKNGVYEKLYRLQFAN